MNKRENDVVRFYRLPIVIAAILFVSIAELPYGFYTFMRIAVPILSIIYLLLAYAVEGKFSLILIPNIIITILWNPILPVYMDKESWVMIDAIAGICELGVAFYAYRLWKENN